MIHHWFQFGILALTVTRSSVAGELVKLSRQLMGSSRIGFAPDGYGIT
jgi:hypothetical protein